MTILGVMNASVLPGSSFARDTSFSREGLQGSVDAGVIRKLERHREHFAVQPCWIHDPGKGVMVEINNSVLGRWNKKLQGYVVFVENVRNADNSSGMNEDHRWLHIDVFATFYVFVPEVGQQLKGEIKKVGDRAAVCLVFDVFTATVFASDDSELHSWNVGDEIHFEIIAFQERKKGPILRGRSLGSSKDFNDIPQSRKRKRQSSENMEVFENGMELGSQNQNSVGFDDGRSSPPKKKKKRKREVEMESEIHLQSNIDEYENEGYVVAENLEEINTSWTPSKKKKKKIKEEPEINLATINNTFEDDVFSSPKKKNKKKIKEEPEILETVNNSFEDEVSTSPTKKKKKKKIEEEPEINLETINNTFEDDVFSSPKKKKKKKIKEEPEILETVNNSFEDEVSSSPKKKKKKKIKEDLEVETETTLKIEHDQEDYLQNEIERESHSKKKKKKRSSH